MMASDVLIKEELEAIEIVSSLAEPAVSPAESI